MIVISVPCRKGLWRSHKGSYQTFLCPDSYILWFERASGGSLGSESASLPDGGPQGVVEAQDERGRARVDRKRLAGTYGKRTGSAGRGSKPGLGRGIGEAVAGPPPPPTHDGSLGYTIPPRFLAAIGRRISNHGANRGAMCA